MITIKTTTESDKLKNTDFDPFMVKETQEVERCKVDALFSIDDDFMAGRSVMENSVIKY